MFFQSWSDFLNMGGYGFYVWLSYGVSLAAIVGLIVQSYRGKKTIFAEVKRELAREQRLQANKTRGGL
ncbi:heme exporter protein CcmD [Bisgaard Taxon 10/6]|uniref:Heme exporter protein D n=1 Tax=Exercitatus varius TaxID=67857 RepID=A0AAW6Q9F3_9PAST|nr:heme exporter protein CcmD [Exercitatus varius]QOF66973.1 heme exporter protein CcmD [Actinobacillus sp. GY-402]MDG2917722.1 heme exporter protein CcmD [Exercitatus varius]MDG2941685.1 heme exporter protein CcmD [Exercitatus varius]MDG2947564.1 heme exporter protein CcmD [Exercitatus varius]MDG2949997.1 heme exporter protein CcmD [Exercitatus varius]